MRPWAQACGSLMLVSAVAAAAQAQGAPAKLPPASLAPSHVARASQGAQADAPQRAAAADDEGVRAAFAQLEGIKLVRKSDGSFVYTGRGFTARIHAHGGLTITDKFSRSSVEFDSKPLDDIHWITYFFRTTFDLMARLDKAFGNDPFRSERREFLEQTRDLRLALLQRNAARALERALHAIWSAASASPLQKRKQTFELWADCSEDGYGDKVRSRIEQYVRERCPVGSACEYTPEELARLNEQRATKRPFAPYAAAGSAP